LVLLKKANRLTIFLVREEKCFIVPKQIKI